MPQKILVAFDDSENAMRAVHYVASHFNRESQVVLFSVLQDTSALCNMDSPELIPYFKSQQSNFCLLEDKKKELVQNALDRARQVLVDAGFSENQIRLKTQPKSEGVARDIVSESHDGYDLIVIGRWGISAIKEFIFGSIAQKVLNLAKDSSVLIVS